MTSAIVVMTGLLLVSSQASSGAPSSDPARAASQREVKMDEWGLRGGATTAPMPEYPRASVEKNVTGTAVAAVKFGTDGRLEEVSILEAPDEDTAAAVEAALERWVVSPPSLLGQSEKLSARGKLTFYFRIISGKGRVMNPDEVPGGSPRPARRGQPAPPNRPGAVSSSPPPAPPQVRLGGHGETPKTITIAELNGLSGDARPFILDVGERDAFKRGHWPGAVNIPADELRMRAGPALPRSRAIVIDCTQEQMWRCRAAGEILAGQKFSNVRLLVR